jgi:flavin reductase (DIM6/NTAB) family NADH-FMN oxidoreductase RutF
MGRQVLMNGDTLVMIKDIAKPMQVILVTCRGEKDSIISLAWHMPLSFTPELYGICVGKTRYSHSLISKSKVFCVNFVDIEFKDDVLFCGSNSGKDVDKFGGTRFKKEECETINCPRIAQALAYLECKVVGKKETGDHTIFIGEVKKKALKRTGKRIFDSTKGLVPLEG